MLYNSYIDTFPGAVMILTSGIAFLGAFIYLYLFTQRKRMLNNSIEQEDNDPIELNNITGTIHM